MKVIFNFEPIKIQDNTTQSVLKVINNKDKDEMKKVFSWDEESVMI